MRRPWRSWVPRPSFLTLAPIAWLGVASAPPLGGQDAVLDTVVVTAARLAETEIAPNTTVITREQLFERGTVSVEQALARVPGFQVISTGSRGQLTSLFARGTESNHSALLIDGVRQPPGLAGGYDLTNLTLDNVDRIEIVRGPQSALYGADAIGAVVNIITRSGRGRQPEFEFSAEGGEFSSFESAAASRGQLRAFDYSIAGSVAHADYERINDAFQLASVRAQTGVQLARNARLGLNLTAYDSDVQSPGSTFIRTPTATFRRSVVTVSPHLQWQPFEPWGHRLTLTYAREDQTYSIPPAVENKTGIDQFQLDYQTDLQVTRNWTLSAGLYAEAVDVQFRLLGGFLGIDQNPSHWATFAQSRLELLPHLTLVNQGRYAEYSSFDSPFTWKHSVSYLVPLTDTLLWASIGTAYSPPSLQDLYFPEFANPFLQPEEAESWEAGLTQHLFDRRLSLSATYFNTAIDNLIQYNPALQMPENLAAASIDGIESSLLCAPVPWLDLEAGYTYLDAVDDTAHLRLLRRPRHTAFGTVTVRPVRGLSLTLGGQWNVDREDIHPLTSQRIDLPDAYTLRAALLWQANAHWSFWLRLENLTDQIYEEVAGYPAPRRAYYLGAKFQF